MEHLTHWKSTRDVIFLQAADLCIGADESGKPQYTTVTLTISGVAEETVLDPSTNTKKKKWVVHFAEKGTKPMIVNTTNKKAIEKSTGTPFLELWVGKKIKIAVERDIKAFGQLTDALRVSAIPVQTEVFKCAICGKEIQEAIYNGSIEKYGVAVCSAECRDKFLSDKETNNE